MPSGELDQRACPACGAQSPKSQVFSEPKAEALAVDELRPFWIGWHDQKIFFSYARCEACGQLYAPTYFTDAQLAQLYADMPPNMDIVADAAIVDTQRGYFQHARRGAVLTGAYLEIGPDVGHVAREAARHGSFDHFWLFEPNRSVAGQLAASIDGKPHTIATDMTDLSIVPDGCVGMAVMIHVLDHLTDPAGMLAQIYAKMRPGGRLVIVTHNEASLLRRVMGTRWPPFCLQHPQIYSPGSITAQLKQAGFTSAKVSASKNYFPMDLLIRSATDLVGVKASWLPLPKWIVGLRLGNMITVATR